MEEEKNDAQTPMSDAGEAQPEETQAPETTPEAAPALGDEASQA